MNINLICVIIVACLWGVCCSLYIHPVVFSFFCSGLGGGLIGLLGAALSE